MKVQQVFLILIVSAISAVASSAEDGRNGIESNLSVQNRIKNGVVHPWTSYRFIVYLRIEKIDGSEILCVGSIINLNYILTTAHCTLNAVRILATIASNHTFLLQPSNVYVHKKFSSINPYNFDAALIRAPLTCFQNYIQSIPLVESNYKANYDNSYVACGWGVTSNGGNYSENLRCATIRLTNCLSYQLLNKNILCGSLLSSSLCYGDFGAPLMLNDYLVGIGSAVNRNCRWNTQTAYTPISAVRRWIDEVIKKEESTNSTN